VNTEGIVLPNAQIIQDDVWDSVYKYTWVLEADQIKQDVMKDKIRTSQTSSFRSKLNGGNMISASTWTVLLVRYTAGIVKYRKE